MYLVYSSSHKKDVAPFIEESRRAGRVITTTDIPEAVVGRLEIALETKK